MMMRKIADTRHVSGGARMEEFRDILDKAFVAARSRARRAGRDFALERSDLDRMFNEHAGRCAVTGMAFSRRRYDDCLVKMPLAPSLDRIDSHGGYAPGNTRLVCVAVNFGLGQWGDELFCTLAVSMIENQPPLARQRPANLDERIRAAEAMMPLLTPAVAASQRRRIAALKRARTLGKDGLRAAAEKARATMAKTTHGTFQSRSISRSC